MKNKFLVVLTALFFGVAANAQSTVDSITAKYKLIPMPEPLTIEKTFPVLGTYQLGAGSDAIASTMGMNAPTTSNDVSVNNANSSSVTNNSTAVSTDAQATSTVTITLDSANKGMIWVEGMPQGKFKAYLKKSPATYRVLAQKTETGTSIPEGTLIFDPASNTLNIALGKDFDETDPTSVFAFNNATDNATATTDNTVKVKVKTPTSKSKSKITYYTATKAQASATATDPAATGTFQSQQSQQVQPTQQQPSMQQSTQQPQTPAQTQPQQ